MAAHPLHSSLPARSDSRAAAPAAPGPWAVRLLGAVEAQGPLGTLSHWPSRAVALLLARVALAPDRIHPREELVELLWPGVALEVGRNRLRQALSTLKTLLEPAGSAAVIQADRRSVRAVPGALVCDAGDFERSVRAGQWDRADALYRGELLPGFYEDWVVDERTRLANLAERLQSMPRLPATPPPVQPAAADAGTGPGQLPHFLTRLFGTEINASRLRELVRHQRLVTVLGAGGSGKTRLAVEAARAVTGPAPWSPDRAEDTDSVSHFDQVVFVSLVDCSDAARALDTIAGSLRVAGREPRKGISQVLAGQRTLMLLDNYEQLAGVADELVLQLLADNASLHILITSRQRLAVTGEQVFELAGLPLPEASERGSADSLASQAAVALFVDRAHAAAADFRLEPAQAAAVCELLRTLAGMPLAIELAASRMRSLSPQRLVDLLAAGQTPMLDLLARDITSQGMAHRHASLRHVVAWSWQQLSPPLIVMMQALAVFAAPALADTLAAVANLDPLAAEGRLEQLRDHSLVVASRDNLGNTRYVLLQPVREFVIERADARFAAPLRQRLREWLITFSQQCTALGHRSIDPIEAELPQVYAAILHAQADGRAAQAQAVALAVALRRHWEIDTRAGPPLAVLRALEGALPAVSDARQRCHICLLLGISFVLAGLAQEGSHFADQALALAVDPRDRSWALARRSNLRLFSAGDLSDVDACMAEALALAQETGDLEGQAQALRVCFLLATNRDDDPDRGERLAHQAQMLWERVGHRRSAYGALMDRASCWIKQGRLDEAASALAACEQAAIQERYATGSIMSSWQLGRVSMKLRQSGVALAAYRRCLMQSWELKRLAYTADALVLVPGGLALGGSHDDLESAARLYGFAVPHWERNFGTIYRELGRDVRLTRRWLFHRLGPVHFDTLRMEGACMSLPEAVALGLGQG
jgi:predicted ATPase